MTCHHVKALDKERANNFIQDEEQKKSATPMQNKNNDNNI
jgi:hypothetical protein